MATGVAHAIELLLENLLTCEVCKEEFDSTSRLPRILPCYHSFCEVCLQILTKEGKVKCPTCRQVAAVTKPLQMDSVRMAVMDWKQSTLGVEGKACQGCSVVAKVAWKCLDCNEFYCRACTDYHRRLKATRSHVLVSLPEAAESLEKLQQTLSEKCLRHPDQILDLFCLTCNMALCSTCAQFQHPKDHEVVKLSQVLDDIKKKMKNTQLLERLGRLRAMQFPHRSIVDYRRNLIPSDLALRMLTASGDLERAAYGVVETANDQEKKRSSPAVDAATLQAGIEKMEELRDLLLYFNRVDPDIWLDFLRCPQWCTVSWDGCSIINQRQSSFGSQETFRFMGTCGTAALPRQTCYWQVHLRASPWAQYFLIDFCEVGVASMETLQEAECFIHSSNRQCRPDSAIIVFLSSEGGRLMAIGQNHDRKEIFKTALAPLNMDDTVEGTLGFLLDVQKQRLVILDADSRQVLCEGKVDMSQPLWPFVNLIWPKSYTDASVCVRVQSGSDLILTPDMDSLIRSLLG